MSVRVALRHMTRYRYGQPVGLAPQIVRLRPAPHARTPVEHFSLAVDPTPSSLHWHQDPLGNWQARAIFAEQTEHLHLDVQMEAVLNPVNPFDFFVEPDAATFPFTYPPRLADALASCLRCEPAGPRTHDFLETLPQQAMPSVHFITEVNRAVYNSVTYRRRFEAGVLPPEDTLENGDGSCRDTSWLLVQVLRHLGLAARFTSGYLVQQALPLTGDRWDLDLHAWAETYLPGAGWIGMDPTSGLLATEGHIPLAATDHPELAAPLEGTTTSAQTTLSHYMHAIVVREEGSDAMASVPRGLAQPQMPR